MIDETGNVVLFREVQRFRQLWVWLLILIVPISCIISILDIVYLEDSGEIGSAENIIALVLLPVFGFGIPWLMYSTNLVTEVRTDGIYIRYFPFHRSFRKVSEGMVNYEARKYHPLREYGGWGIRGMKRNRAYNVFGDIGLQLTYSNGDKLLIGTQKPDELIAAIKSVSK